MALSVYPHSPTRHLVEGTAEATQVEVLENKPLRAFSKRIPFGKMVYRMDKGNKRFLNIKGFDLVPEYGPIFHDLLWFDKTIKLQNGE